MLADAIDLHTIKHVLVIKLRHHGDVLLTSPIFAILKKRAPHLEIDALIYAETKDMLSFHPAISLIHLIERNKNRNLLARLHSEWHLVTSLRQRHYDLVIHTTEHPRGAWLTRLAGARFSVAPHIANRSAWWRASFSHLYKLPRGTLRHTVETNLDALRRIGVYPDLSSEKRLVLEAGREAITHVTNLQEQHKLVAKHYILLHPTSRWLFKCWPEEQVSELITALQQKGHTVVLTTGPDAAELAMAARITSALAQPIIDLAGQLSLKQLAALCASARCFVGVDSAPMHIAAAVQTPVVALFGPSSEVQWAPWQVRHRIVNAEYSCRPCGNDGCGGGKVSDCLRSIPVSAALQAIHEIIQ